MLATLPRNNISPGLLPVTHTPRLLIKTTIGILTGLVILSILPPAFLLAYLGLAIYAARGPKESIQALSLMAILLQLNPGLFSTPSTAKLLRWLVLFAAFGRVLFDTAPKPNQITYPIILFSSSIFILSLIASQSAVISALKVFVFGIGTFTIITCFYRTLHLGNYWSSWFFTLGILVLGCSAPLYFSYLGYLRNGTGFQGILNHPQVYGPVAAAISAWATCLFLFAKRKTPLITICMALGWMAIYTSQARTSLVMAMGGLCLTLLIGCTFKQAWRREIGHTFSVFRTIGLLVMCSVVAILFGPRIMETAQDFILKGDESVSYEESFQGSRGELIQQQINNFKKFPVAGIGFGVASTPNKFYASSAGIPVGASVEKGFMPSAVLEEMGLTGAILVLFLLFSLVKPIFQGQDISAMAILLTSLLINIGEMVFFSLGGIGLFFWIMIGFAFNQALSVSHQAGTPGG